MSSRDGCWRLHLDGVPDVTTDDLTLDDVEIAERVCGVPYVMLNPLASAKEAKALLTVLLVRAGRTEDDALEAARRTPLRVISRAFTWVPPDRPLRAVGDDSDPPASAPTSVAG